MDKYLELIEELPKEIQGPILKILQALREDIANTVTKSDFNELKLIVQELVEAQKRTEAEVQKLAEAQKRTEEELKELARAQKRIEEKLSKLIIDHEATKKQVGGLSFNVGFNLENIAYKGLPPLLKRDFNLDIKDRLYRRNIVYADGNYDQIDIYGIGIRDGEELYIIGECKAQLSKKDINSLPKLINRLKIKAGFKNIISFFVTHYADPKVEEYIKEKNVRVYYSYEF